MSAWYMVGNKMSVGPFIFVGCKAPDLFHFHFSAKIFRFQNSLARTIDAMTPMYPKKGARDGHVSNPNFVASMVSVVVVW
jgi:hypothetical protein